MDKNKAPNANASNHEESTMNAEDLTKKTAQFAANKAEYALDREPTAADYSDTSDVPSAVVGYTLSAEEIIDAAEPVSLKRSVPAGTFTREIVSNQRVRLPLVEPGDVIPGLGEVVSNEPNGRFRTLTFTDGSTYNASFRKFEHVERRV